MKQILLLFSLVLVLNSSLFAQADVESLVDVGNDLVKLNRYDEAMEKYNEALDY